MSAFAVFHNMLFGVEPDGSYAELRAVWPGQPTVQTFFPVRRPDPLEAAVHVYAATHDVYVGVAPRTRQDGTRDAIRRAHALWADLDTPEAVAALGRFAPAPSIVVSSGRDGHAHAYWSLWPPATRDELEDANRRLAHALGGDRVWDAARVLRPPGSVNHKCGRTAEIVQVNVEIYETGDVVGDLPDPPENGNGHRPHRDRQAADDRLLGIAPAEYVEALLGTEVGRDGKVCCPFHHDTDPSLHVYDEPERGWFCFGCWRGGDIYNFAAELAGVDHRTAFVALRDYLEGKFR